MTGLQHPLVQDYLARLDRAGAGLPPEIRAELSADLSAHLDSALTSTSSDADVRNALQELGAPEDVAAAAYDGLGSASPPAAGGPAGPTMPTGPTVPDGATQPMTAPMAAPVPGGPVWPMPPPSPWGPVEIMAVLGLTIGMFVVPVVGPLVGLVMAWVSDRWTKREKVVATALCVLPVVTVLVVVVGLVGVSSSSSSSGGAPEPSYSSTVVTGGTP